METAWSWAVLGLLATALFWILSHMGGGLRALEAGQRSLEDAVRDNSRQLAALTVEVGTIGYKVDGHEERFDRVDQRFDGVDQRFDGVDQRFDGVDQRFDRVEAKLEEHDRRFDRVEAKLEEHDRRLDSHDERFDSHDARFDSLEALIREQGTQLSGQIYSVATKLDEHLRRHAS
jgi:chromosome segregation ATPase